MQILFHIQDECLDGPYEFKLVDKEYGSCVHYDTRTLILKEEIINLSYEDVVEKYGDKLVMVASIEERWHSLAAHCPFSIIELLTPAHYCVLELIGKSRENVSFLVLFFEALFLFNFI